MHSSSSHTEHMVLRKISAQKSCFMIVADLSHAELESLYHTHRHFEAHFVRIFHMKPTADPNVSQRLKNRGYLLYKFVLNLEIANC